MIPLPDMLLPLMMEMFWCHQWVFLQPCANGFSYTSSWWIFNEKPFVFFQITEYMLRFEMGSVFLQDIAIWNSINITINLDL